MVSATWDRLQKAREEPEVTHSHGPLRQRQQRIWDIAERSGWHKDSDTPYHYLSALGSEVGEAHNAFRDHGTKRAVVTNVVGYDRVTGEPNLETPGKPEGVGPELADVIIRALHLAEYLGIDMDAEVQAKLDYLDLRQQRKRVFDN